MALGLTTINTYVIIGLFETWPPIFVRKLGLTSATVVHIQITNRVLFKLIFSM